MFRNGLCYNLLNHNKWYNEIRVYVTAILTLDIELMTSTFLPLELFCK